MKIEPDPWLARIFGCDVFKVSLPDGAETEGIPKLSVDTLFPTSQKRCAFYYTKVPTRCVDQVQTLASLGFSVVDVNVIFERKPAKQIPSGSSRSIAIRDASPAEQKEVMGIAATCFVYSRFHLDPQIPGELANAVKRAWVESYFRRQRGERLLVAELGGKLVGFLAILATTTGGERVGVIDLIGVGRPYQGLGVGRQLVDFFIRDSAEEYDSLRVGTQVVNIPSMRLYEGSGFRIAESAYVLHAHAKGV